MEAIAEVFNEVQESTSVSQKQVYALLEQYETNKAVFLKATEQCYLKIIKSLLKAPRKLIEKYEKLTEKLFETGYRQYALKEDQSSKKQKLTKRDIFGLFQHFLAFFAGALDSTQLQIRIFSSRIIFQLLKILPSDTLVDIIEAKVAKQLILGTLSLMKEKKGNLKHIGIKITSYLQKLMDRQDLTDTQEAKILRSEMMKSMCMDDQDQIRKLALINLEMNESTFPHLIKRIRDKNPEIRATVFKKLIKEQIPLANLNLSDIYKLIYDGLGSRESSVREACIRYLQLNYNQFKEDDENAHKNQNEEQMELEENKEKEGEKEESAEDNEIDEEKIKKKQSKSAIKRFFTPNKETAMKDLKIKILNFLKTFEIEKSLYYPELYESLELLVKETIKQILDADSFSAYLKDCFLNQLSLKKKKKHTQISIEGEELFLIRVLCQMVQNQDDRKELSPELVAVVEDCFPNGVDFSQVIEYYSFTQPNLFSLYQVLLLAELLINCDESGRNKIEETLKNLVINMSNNNLISEIPTDPSNEYNDIFYQLEPDVVMNNIFAQSYFFSPIITCSYELLPIIVRILKKIVSDGRVNIQLIQLISEVHEPLAKDTDNDSHFDLPSELERIKNSITEEKKKLENMEKELVNLKKNKTKQNEIYLLEKERDEKLAHLKIWEEKEDNITTKIFDISMRELVLVQSLLTYCKVDPKDPAISNLLQQIILPGLHSGERSLNFNSLKSLALYVLIDKKNCVDFFSVFSEILEKEEAFQNCSPQEIISLRSIVDFLLLYDLTQKQSEDDEDIDIPQTQELIVKHAFQSDLLLRTISIEGLSKLLFNGKLQDPHTIICLLLVIWFDTKICQKQGFKAIQILSTLFKTFTASNYFNLQIFEKALELFSQLIVTLEKKGLVFNDEFVIFDHSNEKFISKALRVGINLMSYEYHNNTEALKNLSSNEFPPQERFFLFLAYKCSKERRFQSLFEKVTQYFDFYNKCSTEQLQIILHFLKEAIDNCPVSKQFNQLEKVIKDKIKIQDKNERQEEDEEKEELNKVLGKEKSDNQDGNEGENAENGAKNDEDNKLYTLNAKQLKICDKIIELFEGNQQDIEVIIKNLFSNGTLINDSAEQKKKRAMMYDEEDEERANNEEDDENEKEEKPKRGRPAKRKHIHPNSEEEEEGEEDDEQEEGAQEETKRRGRPKKDNAEASHTAPSQRGRKKKVIYEQEEEEDNEEEEDQDKKDSKKNSANRKAKNSKELEEILNQETEEDEDDEDREEVINKRTSSRRAQKTVAQETTTAAQKNSRRGRKRKEEQDEVIEENEEEEDDDQEEQDMSAEEDVEEDGKQNKKQTSGVKRGRKPGKARGSSSEKESPKITNRRGRRSASKENKISEESDEENKESVNEDEEDQSQKKTRGRGRPKKSNQKSESEGNEEEEQENSQSENEEEQEEEEAPRKTRGSSKKSTPAQKKSKTRSSQKSANKEESGEEEQEDGQEEEEEEQKPQKRGRGRPKAQSKESESEQEEQDQSDQEQENESEQEEQEEQPRRRGRKPKNANQPAARSTRHASGNKKSDKEESGEENDEAEDEEEEQTKVTRRRGRKQAEAKKTTKTESVRSTRRGGSRNKMEEENEDEEENESSDQENEEQEEDEEQPKTRGRPKKTSANKDQPKENRGRGRRKNEKQQSQSQSEEDGEEDDEEEEEENANQRTTRRQKQQIEVQASKKAVSSSQRLRRRK